MLLHHIYSSDGKLAGIGTPTTGFMWCENAYKAEQQDKMFKLLCEIAVFSKDLEYAEQAKQLVKQIKQENK